MKKRSLLIGSIFIATLSLLLFIHFSNDHVECDRISNSITNVDGVVVKTESHICKEKYSF